VRLDPAIQPQRPSWQAVPRPAARPGWRCWCNW
jgi:hypothetical protein